MAINTLQFAGLLLHVIGVIIFGGGQFWIKIFMARIDRSQNPGVKLYFVQMFPTIFKITIWGLLLLFLGGVIGLVALNEPSFVGLPQTWGWVMLIKVLLYVAIVISSILIKEIFIPEVIETIPRAVEDESFEVFPRAASNLNRILNVNLVLTLAVVVLGVIAQVI